MFVKQLQVGLFAVFAYIVGDEETKEGLIIDPAANIDGILSTAKRMNIDIRYIVNTHGHVDHAAGNAEMKRKTGAKIVIHQDDANQLTSTPALFLRMFRAKASPPADILVTDGSLISLGKTSLKVIHTPGHSPGGIALYSGGCVFTGDTLFVGSVGRSDLPGASWPVMYRSIQKLFTLPDETKVLPGHNYGPTPTSTIGHEKKYNPYIQ
jgi:glyoxylase-like metal-dependent hydrolase (beta-lactamase superfamily II)